MRFTHFVRLVGSAGTVIWWYLLITGNMSMGAVIGGALAIGGFWGWQFKHGLHYRPYLTVVSMVAVGFSSLLGTVLFYIFGLEGTGILTIMVMIVTPGFVAIIGWPIIDFARQRDRSFRDWQHYFQGIRRRRAIARRQTAVNRELVAKH